MLIEDQAVDGPQHLFIGDQPHIVHQLPHLSHIAFQGHPRCQAIGKGVAGVGCKDAPLGPRPVVSRGALRLHANDARLRAKVLGGEG